MHSRRAAVLNEGRTVTEVFMLSGKRQSDAGTEPFIVKVHLNVHVLP